MSIEVMSLAWYVEGVTPAQKAVLVALADHAGDDGKHVYPSVDRLTVKTSYAERTVRRALADLREKGLIHIVNEATHNFPTEYELDLPEMQAMRCTRFDRGARNAPHDLPENTDRGARNAPKPSKETSEQPSSGGGSFDNLFAEAVQQYEANLTTLTPIIVDNIKEAIDKYPSGWVVEAIGIAAAANKRSWSYVDGILRNWERKGHQDTRRTAGQNGTGAPHAVAIDDQYGGFSL